MSSFAKHPSPSPERPEASLPPLIPERNLTERTAYVLQAYQTYGAMSNDKYRAQSAVERAENAGQWGSLEDIHNAVHNLTGGVGDVQDSNGYGGHMASVPNSSFDPIFWLHHTNIDRLFDIWQALHEDDDNVNTFVTPQKAGVGDFTVAPGGEESKTTKLYPFRFSIDPRPESWYTSAGVKRTEKFGYTYPETAGLSYPSTPAQKKKLFNIISRAYESPVKLITESKQHIETAGQNLLGQAHILKEIEAKKVSANVEQLESLAAQLPDNRTLLKTSLERSKPVLRDLAPQNKYLEWITNIKAAKHEFGGAYTVHVFLGPPDEQRVALWPASPTHVDQADHIEVTGQVPLTLALMERYLAGLIDNLTPASVVPYLTKNLHWRVAKNDGTVVEDRSQVTGLTVFVVTNEVTLPEDNYSLPIYAPDVEIYPKITTSQNGNGRGNGTGLTAGDLPS
ncbi:MAG: hypothetical protein Q9165_006199 [Trypethelium subeluteriae]